MKFNEKLKDFSEEIGDFGKRPFKLKEEEEIYQILKPYFDDTFDQEIEAQNEECRHIGYDAMRVLIIEIDKISSYLKEKNKEDLIDVLVDYHNKSINRLLFKIIVKWCRNETISAASYYGIFYYFDHKPYGNIIKLYYCNGG
jgi:hypothetical protein